MSHALSVLSHALGEAANLHTAHAQRHSSHFFMLGLRPSIFLKKILGVEIFPGVVAAEHLLLPSPLHTSSPPPHAQNNSMACPFDCLASPPHAPFLVLLHLVGLVLAKRIPMNRVRAEKAPNRDKALRRALKTKTKPTLPSILFQMLLGSHTSRTQS